MKDFQLTSSQLAYLKDNLPPSIAAVAFGIVAIVVVFYGEVPDNWLIGWSICAWAVLLFRTWVYLHIKQTIDKNQQPIRTKNLILLSATATGICWGAGSIISSLTGRSFHRFLMHCFSMPMNLTPRKKLEKLWFRLKALRILSK